uniref:Uncharacterized protein n=1 Tax=Anguilla anguilla TaxID=7936 RepID=A0A0E9W8V9_ANGAN
MFHLGWNPLSYPRLLVCEHYYSRFLQPYARRRSETGAWRIVVHWLGSCGTAANRRSHSMLPMPTEGRPPVHCQVYRRKV